jgi:phage terminase small subunit
MNAKQTLFVSHYLQTGNATEAYKLVYGVNSDEQAAANASRLIRNDKVQAEIEKFKTKVMDNTGITIEQTVKRIARLASKAQKDSDKLKALDMLMKHLGGYVTINDIIEKMTPEQLESLSNQLLSKLHKNESK